MRSQNASGMTGRTAIEITAVGLVSDAPVSGRFIIGSELVTQENADQYYFPDSPF